MHTAAVVRRLLFVCLLPLACTAPVGVSGTGVQVPADGLAQCQSQCGVMGLRAVSVVAMAGRIGCVCEPKEASTDAGDSSAALAGGMAAIFIQEQQDQQRQQQAP